jgi:hypothetical protein
MGALGLANRLSTFQNPFLNVDLLAAVVEAPEFEHEKLVQPLSAQWPIAKLRTQILTFAPRLANGQSPIKSAGPDCPLPTVKPPTQ